MTVPAGWGNTRPGSTGIAVGVPKAKDQVTDPYASCPGWKLTKIGLTASQVNRVHALLRRRGLHSSCTHDLHRGILVSDLMSGDGPEQGTSLDPGPNTPISPLLAALRPI